MRARARATILDSEQDRKSSGHRCRRRRSAREAPRRAGRESEVDGDGALADAPFTGTYSHDALHRGESHLAGRRIATTAKAVRRVTAPASESLPHCLHGRAERLETIASRAPRAWRLLKSANARLNRHGCHSAYAMQRLGRRRIELVATRSPSSTARTRSRGCSRTCSCARRSATRSSAGRSSTSAPRSATRSAT